MMDGGPQAEQAAAALQAACTLAPMMPSMDSTFGAPVFLVFEIRPEPTEAGLSLRFSLAQASTTPSDPRLPVTQSRFNPQLRQSLVRRYVVDHASPFSANRESMHRTDRVVRQRARSLARQQAESRRFNDVFQGTERQPDRCASQQWRDDDADVVQKIPAQPRLQPSRKETLKTTSLRDVALAGSCGDQHVEKGPHTRTTQCSWQPTGPADEQQRVAGIPEDNCADSGDDLDCSPFHSQQLSSLCAEDEDTGGCPATLACFSATTWWPKHACRCMK